MGKPSNTPKPTLKAKKVDGSPKYKSGVCESYLPLVKKYDWDVRIAMAVMRAESGCIEDRDNAGMNTDGTNDVGLFQINSIHVKSGLISDKDRRNPAKNIKAAYAIYQGRLQATGNGWTAWVAYQTGAYRKWL